MTQAGFLKIVSFVLIWNHLIKKKNIFKHGIILLNPHKLLILHSVPASATVRIDAAMYSSEDDDWEGLLILLFLKLTL